MPWKISRILVTLVGVVVFVGLLAASAGSAHADLLRWAALAWLAALGLINAVIVLRDRAAAPRMPRRDREHG